MQMVRIFLIIPALGIGLVLALPVAGIEITAGSPAEDEGFGFSTFISGNDVIVGTLMGNSAYIFAHSGTDWTEQIRLPDSGTSTASGFGRSVCIDKDHAIVGALGAAYIFKRDGTSWTQPDTLTVSNATPGAEFGYSVAISGDHAIAGAWLEDFPEKEDAGAAYIFACNGTSWTERGRLTASDAKAEDRFGVSVSINGQYAIVGADCADSSTGDTGAAYIFVHNGTSWTEQDKLTASDAQAGDGFGCSVCIHGKYAIVGAYSAEAAYIFMRDGTSWTEQGKLTASDAQAGDGFGRSVCIHGQNAIVGAAGADFPVKDAGAAYIFARNSTSWTEKAKLTASDAQADDGFGKAVSINKEYVVVGANGTDDAEVDSGSVYIYPLSTVLP